MEKNIEVISSYAKLLNSTLDAQNWNPVLELTESLLLAWEKGKRVYLCGNGGSAANALHLANDYNYGISPSNGKGLRVIALPANISIITCIANDISYDDIFAQQLSVQGEPGDILIVLSGSGNSPNVVKALEQAKKLNMKTFAILGFDGGKCIKIADTSIHIKINDMQIAEDMQLIIGHMIMKFLRGYSVN